MDKNYLDENAKGQASPPVTKRKPLSKAAKERRRIKKLQRQYPTGNFSQIGSDPEPDFPNLSPDAEAYIFNELRRKLRSRKMVYGKHMTKDVMSIFGDLSNNERAVLENWINWLCRNREELISGKYAPGKLNVASPEPEGSSAQPIGGNPFGVIDVDPCAHKLSDVLARRRIFFSEGGDGLKENWIGKFVFVNPPFSAIVDWLQYAHAQWRDGHAKTVACLIPIRTDTKFFHDKLRKNADIFVLKGRVSFLMPSGKKQSNFQPLFLVVFGATKKQKARYQELADGFWLERTASRTKYRLVLAEVSASWRELRSLCSNAIASIWSWIVS